MPPTLINQLLPHSLSLGILFFFTSHVLFSQNDTLNFPAGKNASPLTGFVDMHTHPRSDMAFGGELFYGSPYGKIEDALKNCKPYHGSYNLFTNRNGNIFRNKVVDEGERLYCKNWPHKKEGYPNFTDWPVWCSVFHQQMWIDWIERAHKGGLNIMVAMAVHSHCMADAAETKEPYDDKTAMDTLIQGIKALVNNSTFMELALTPADVRRIVNSGKLAVLLGLEMDNIGNFYNPVYKGNSVYNPNPTEGEIKAELDRLWDLNVRYIIPIHLTNNVFGGSAIYLPPLSVANKYNTGAEFIPEEVNTSETGITFTLEHPILTTNPEAEFIPRIALRMAGGIIPESVNPSRKENYTFREAKPGIGHRNSLTLTDRGRYAIKYMMQKGFLIDIDHMSEKAANEVLEMAVMNDYPVNSGHNHLRGAAGNENNRTIKQYTQIKQVGGMVGLGHSEYASNFVKKYRATLSIMDNRNVAIGTDANGFYPLPHPDKNIFVEYDSINFTRCTTGNKTWDINSDGFAHYGLFPDYIKSWEAAGMTPDEKNIFMSSAEYFTEMWEKCEAQKNKIKYEH